MYPDRKRQRCWRLAAFVLGWFAVCAGCGKSPTTVQGTVTFDGQPVANGSIVFEPADGAGPTAGGQIVQGKYQLADVAPGDKIVRITAIRETGRQVDSGLQTAGTATGPSAPGQAVDEVEQFIPAIYNQDSTLTCEVVVGANQHDFDLNQNPE